MRGLLDLLVGQRHQPMGAGLAAPAAVRRGALAARGDLAVGVLGERADLVLGHVAGDDEDGVLRRVEALVIGERVLAVERLDLVHPADDRRAVGMMREQRGLHRLVELRGGIGVGAHAALLEHHVALGRDDLVGQDEIGHAVGLELHHRPADAPCATRWK